MYMYTYSKFTIAVTAKLEKIHTYTLFKNVYTYSNKTKKSRVGLLGTYILLNWSRYIFTTRQSLLHYEVKLFPYFISPLLPFPPVQAC